MAATTPICLRIIYSCTVLTIIAMQGAAARPAVGQSQQRTWRAPGAAPDGIRTWAALPPFLASRRSPLRLAAASTAAARVLSGQGFGPGFCKQAGLLCRDDVELAPLRLFSLTTYLTPSSSSLAPHHHPSPRLLVAALIRTMSAGGLFFREDMLALGSPVKLPPPFPPLPPRAFLPPGPLHQALSPMFSLEKLPLLLHLLGISQGSPMALNMKETLQACVAPPKQGESKACVSSIEEMVDFVASLLGTQDLEGLTGTNASLAGVDAAIVEDVVEVMSTAPSTTTNSTTSGVACHNAMFPCQFFYCHYLQGSKLFKVALRTLENQNHQSKYVSILVSCHDLMGVVAKLSHLVEDTEEPREFICHWNFEDTIMWIPRHHANLDHSIY